MKHLDLFSGIGGFALACEWNGIETIGFVEIDKFCQKVLKKHWPNVPIVEDINNVEEIKAIVTSNTTSRRCGQCVPFKVSPRDFDFQDSLLLTAGFPCQPFSNAGRKRGSADDRYLWPQTLAVIESVKPDWIILENVPGILNMVFPDNEVRVASQTSLFDVPNDEISDYRTISGGIESDLRKTGYETVWMVIPACSLSAPHRRDRVWIVANAKSDGNGIRRIHGNNQNGERKSIQAIKDNRDKIRSSSGTDNAQDLRNRATPNSSDNGYKGRYKVAGEPQRESEQGRMLESQRENSHVTDTTTERLQSTVTERTISTGCATKCDYIPGWAENWYEVAAEFCRVDARIPDRVDRLKSLGNAIVPQVAYQLIKAIKEIDIYL